MTFYAETPGYRARQVMGDALVVLWVVVWARVGMLVHELVGRLAGPARTLERAGAGFARPLQDASDSVGDVPVIGDALGAPLDAAAGAGRVLARAGASQQDVVVTLALWLGILFAVLPIAIVLLRVVPARLRWVRDASAARRMRNDEVGAELFALRAVATRPLEELRRAVPDPARAWATGDLAPLAALELRELGLRPTGAQSSEPRSGRPSRGDDASA
jgi:hypothetical protein